MSTRIGYMYHLNHLVSIQRSPRTTASAVIKVTPHSRRKLSEVLHTNQKQGSCHYNLQTWGMDTAHKHIQPKLTAATQGRHQEVLRTGHFPLLVIVVVWPSKWQALNRTAWTPTAHALWKNEMNRKKQPLLIVTQGWGRGGNVSLEQNMLGLQTLNGKMKTGQSSLENIFVWNDTSQVLWCPGHASIYMYMPQGTRRSSKAELQSHWNLLLGLVFDAALQYKATREWKVAITHLHTLTEYIYAEHE